jgi:two-component system, NtrC family, nitrogen regulation sensor histidine kinase NtrY
VKAWQDMADVLTHEMMNSLTPISSLSESLEALLRESNGARAPGDEVAGALEAIKRRSRGLMDFVGRYRAVADLPSPQVAPVGLREFMRGIDRLMTPVLRERGIAYRSSVNPEHLTCVADPQLLEQAIINLMRNAADAVAGVDVPRVEITCEPAGERVALVISDNGCGVPDARREQIFVPFFTTKSGGSGIGLNLARQVVLAHNGQIDVRPNVPRGSVFTLTLPSAQPG